MAATVARKPDLGRLVRHCFSGTIELLQGEYFDRSADWLDFAANSAGALAGIPLARLAERLIFKKDSGNETPPNNDN